jgi:hypothetical protein
VYCTKPSRLPWCLASDNNLSGWLKPGHVPNNEDGEWGGKIHRHNDSLLLVCCSQLLQGQQQLHSGMKWNAYMLML